MSLSPFAVAPSLIEGAMFVSVLPPAGHPYPHSCYFAPACSSLLWVFSAFVSTFPDLCFCLVFHCCMNAITTRSLSICSPPFLWEILSPANQTEESNFSCPSYHLRVIFTLSWNKQDSCCGKESRPLIHYCIIALLVASIYFLCSLMWGFLPHPVHTVFSIHAF